jgi:hypothetical protein
MGRGNAYGSIPEHSRPRQHGPGAVSGAMTLGNQAYSQLPGYSSSLGNIGANIQARDGGAVAGGRDPAITTAGGGARHCHRARAGARTTTRLILRALGLTSLDLTRQGQDALLKQLPALPGAQISQNPNFYVDPRQQQEAATNAIYRSAPDPRAAAMRRWRRRMPGLRTGEDRAG